ncbi:MAG: hypothetical protein HY744_13080 [Deltaproteobacteria bacterium]|nr:hypothetical protein [Deltaproteobacteria bacterium]
MPLAFASPSHGTVAFGFFNVETDMLLLEQMFFFADRFCAAVVALAEAEVAGRGAATIVDGWRIDAPELVGDLHGAIAGVHLSGFIGATYREHPFPPRRQDFKQSPEGERTQAAMAALIARFGRRLAIDVVLAPDRATVAVGEVVFSTAGFGELVGYVERGGYPRYRDKRRPACVRTMTDRLAELRSPWLPRPAGHSPSRRGGGVNA